jgi:small subunit ribosomal protein S6
MPGYELAVIYRMMAKPELSSVIRRSAEAIIDRGGVVTKFENLGFRTLPHKMTSHDHLHWKGSYMLIHYSGSPRYVNELIDFYKRDIDIIKAFIYRADRFVYPTECTLHEEILPVPYRPEIIKLLEQSKENKARKDWNKYELGVPYNPF